MRTRRRFARAAGTALTLMLLTLAAAGLIPAAPAQAQGPVVGIYTLKLIDFGRGASDPRQWVVTFPVEGNNGRVPNTCGP